ncbi:hypothetical protein COBT_001517 [Conglomerata obtusa]
MTTETKMSGSVAVAGNYDDGQAMMSAVLLDERKYTSPILYLLNFTKEFQLFEENDSSQIVSVLNLQGDCLNFFESGIEICYEDLYSVVKAHKNLVIEQSRTPEELDARGKLHTKISVELSPVDEESVYISPENTKPRIKIAYEQNEFNEELLHKYLNKNVLINENSMHNSSENEVKGSADFSNVLIISDLDLTIADNLRKCYTSIIKLNKFVEKKAINMKNIVLFYTKKVHSKEWLFSQKQKLVEQIKINPFIVGLDKIKNGVIIMHPDGVFDFHNTPILQTENENN